MSYKHLKHLALALELYDKQGRDEWQEDYELEDNEGTVTESAKMAQNNWLKHCLQWLGR